MLNYLWFTFRSRVRRHIRSERGSMAIEYIGLAILSLAILGLLASYVKDGSNGGNTIGQAFVDRIKDLIAGTSSSTPGTD